MKIELAWPDKRVFPNWRQSHHWRTYSGPVAAQREYARLATFADTTRAERANLPPEGPITLVVTFHQPDRRKRDDDGMIGAFKSARDGIADALGIDDARFAVTYRFPDVRVKGGRIDVEVLL